MGPKRRSKDKLTNLTPTDADNSEALRDFKFPDTEEISQCINQIMNTLSFRKLAGKTQVILSLSGPDIRTRLTHTIEVAKISRDICARLQLNEDLAEAIALAHDIGHTPFGHVGERTLREIMCGCDTIGDRVADFDFANSGFKHNLQSFRVLINGERILHNKENINIWPYILWGALTHSKTSWSKPYSGMADEIKISPKHCNLVYACHYHETKQCKRNVQYKVKKDIPKVRDKGKKEEKRGKQETKKICKPWYCATVEIERDADNVEPKELIGGETSKEYINKKHFKKKYQKLVYCRRKCYLAKLWKHKIVSKPISIEHPYLFDHPFPNSFYAKHLNDNFFTSSGDGNWVDCISLEAVIVSHADEIAQRQQDLEDGISKNLISFDKAKDEVKKMVEAYKGLRYSKKLLTGKTKSDELGKALVKFYSDSIVDATIQNVQRYIKPEGKPEKINVYSLVNILYSMGHHTNEKGRWIAEELERIQDKNWDDNDMKNSSIGNHYDLDMNQAYLYLLAHDYLENCVKEHAYIENKEICNTILSECLKCLSVAEGDPKKGLSKLNNLRGDLIKEESNGSPDSLKQTYYVIQLLDGLRDYLENIFKAPSKDFYKAKKKMWKEKGDLDLPNLLCLYSIYREYFKNHIGFSIIDLADVNVDDSLDVSFDNMKKILKYDTDKVLKNIVGFIPDGIKTNAKKKKMAKALSYFKDSQKNTILKSEIVEKNDGKANYILRRLFKAYTSNSHQLPDTAFKFILKALVETGVREDLIKSENLTFEEILNNIKKTIRKEGAADTKIKELMKVDFFEVKDSSLKKLRRGTSNEIRAAIDDRRDLYKSLKENIYDKSSEIDKMVSSEKEEDIKDLKETLNSFRGVLDNSILNATPHWKSLLARGICDYIASLTDQEAINEYERLYAGVMELV